MKKFILVFFLFASCTLFSQTKDEIIKKFLNFVDSKQIIQYSILLNWDDESKGITNYSANCTFKKANHQCFTMHQFLGIIIPSKTAQKSLRQSEELYFNFAYDNPKANILMARKAFPKGTIFSENPKEIRKEQKLIQEALIKLVDKRKIDYEILCNTNNYNAKTINKNYHINGYPSYYLIDKKGIIRYSSSGYGDGVKQDWVKEIKKVIN